MDKDKVAKAFNEWMRRYTQEPSRFGREWQEVSEFLKAEADGREPEYGQVCAAYLDHLMTQVA